MGYMCKYDFQIHGNRNLQKQTSLMLAVPTSVATAIVDGGEGAAVTEKDFIDSMQVVACYRFDKY